MAFQKNALMCIGKDKKVKLINHDCLLILMLLCIMLAYLMLFVCLMFSLPLIFENSFFSCFVWVHLHIVCSFQVLFCIMHSAFNLLVFPNAMFTVFCCFL